MEVLVALTILSISLAVLLGIFSQSLVRTSDTEHEMAARLLAKSLLAQANAYQSLSFGQQSGKAQGGLEWRLRVAPYLQQDDKIAPAHASIVSATINWPHGTETRSVTLTTLQIHAKNAAQ